MLPPLRNVPTPARSASLTLSDCSDLSISSPDDLSNPFNNANNTNPIHNHNNNNQPFTPYLPSINHGFQLLHTPTTVSVIPPVNPTPTSAPAHATRPTPTIAKAPKKLARARAKLSNNRHSASTPAPAHFKPTPPKKVRSSKSNIPGESRYWTPSEHKLFVEALLKYGPKDLKSISAYVGTRNMIQCRTHEQKCFMRLMREAQRETFLRNGHDWQAAYGSPPATGEDGKPKHQKDVYSVPSSCGIALLCVVSEEMTRALES